MATEHIHPIFERLVDRAERESRLRQRAKVFWLTGLSGSGKSTIAQGVERLTADQQVPGSNPGVPSILVAAMDENPRENSPTRIRTAVAGFRVLSANHYTMGDGVARWPSGLRRCVKAAISSEAWVRTPPSSLFHL